MILRLLEYYWSKLVKVARGSAIADSTIDKSSRVHSGTTFICSRLARHSFVGYECTILNTEIGPFCSLASRITIGGATHPIHFVSTSPAFLSHKDSIKKKFARHVFNPAIRTTIGADVWVGDGAYLKAGVKIGHGAVIGMGAVVTKDVAPYAVVAGNPARVIKYRFEPEVISGLLESQWWTLTDDELAALGDHFTDPVRFLHKLRAQ